MRLARSLAAAALLAVACGSGAGPHAGRGVVIDVDREAGRVVIEHGEIEGLMAAMTMTFEVPDPALLATLAPGQEIDFEVEASRNTYHVVAATVRSQRPPAREGPKPGGVVDLGHRAPDFRLEDQDGRPVSLDGLRGSLVLLDFVYTHCPGPCPTLTGVHVEVQKRLPPDLGGRVRFVSISLDPERDTPERLRDYARGRGADLATWSFLGGAPEAIDPVLAAFGVGRSPGDSGEIDHLVATFLIDPEGRVARRWIGLDHSADEILADLARVARG